MSRRAAIVLQARMGSTRLPGKVMASVAGASVLARCIERLGCATTAPVIVATTIDAADDVVEEEARRMGAEVVRGPVDDVLARYALAVRTFALAQLVRATADNPAVDIDASARCLALLNRTGVDHVVERGLPYGAAVEAVSARAILVAADDATDASDREHVTTFIKRERRFVALDAIAPATVRRPDLRFTVDTPEDLEFMRHVYGQLPADAVSPASLVSLIAAADRVGGRDAATMPPASQRSR